MTCASHELIAAMRGEVGAGFDPNITERFGHDVRACDLKFTPVTLCWAWDGTRSDESVHTNLARVTCPACRLLMAAATDPMRWDTLLARGLVKELEAVVRVDSEAA